MDVDASSGDTFNKKIRNAQLAQYNYILGRGHCHVTCMWTSEWHAKYWHEDDYLKHFLHCVVV